MHSNGDNLLGVEWLFIMGLHMLSVQLLISVTAPKSEVTGGLKYCLWTFFCLKKESGKDKGLKFETELVQRF